MTVTVILNGESISIERDAFSALFMDSVVSSYAGVGSALDGKPLPFRDFVSLARKAEIPYPLFFAPLEVVQAQLDLKVDKLMSGFTKASFSMHSRNRVELRDVELIVRDLLRKQDLLRKNRAGADENKVVGLLKGSRGPVEDDANRLLEAIGLTRSEIRTARSKEAALEVLVRRLEEHQILVSRSAKDFMPQRIPAGVRFSGMTIKDKRFPFIFLATGDEGEHLEPAGRKLFTLTLLTVLIARGTFAPVTYDGHTKDESSPPEYQLTAEMLMPAKEVQQMGFSDLDAVKEAADTFRVTPSAVAMRARRLGLIGMSSFETFMDTLRAEYANRAAPPRRSPLPVNALRSYNGVEFSRRMLALLDSGRINATEFRRVVLLNKVPTSQINAFREAVG